MTPHGHPGDMPCGRWLIDAGAVAPPVAHRVEGRLPPSSTTAGRWRTSAGTSRGTPDCAVWRSRQRPALGLLRPGAGALSSSWGLRRPPTHVRPANLAKHGLHPAAGVRGVAYVCTVPPWPHAPAPPYVGRSQAEQTERAVDELEPWLHQQGELVWGGDWNHPLAGSLQGFTRRGHDRIKAVLDALRLTAHTEHELAQQKKLGRSGSVDHLASRHPRQPVEVTPGKPYSTHDAYAVAVPSSPGQVRRQQLA